MRLEGYSFVIKESGPIIQFGQEFWNVPMTNFRTIHIDRRMSFTILCKVFLRACRQTASAEDVMKLSQFPRLPTESQRNQTNTMSRDSSRPLKPVECAVLLLPLQKQLPKRGSESPNDLPSTNECTASEWLIDNKTYIPAVYTNKYIPYVSKYIFGMTIG